MKTVSKVEAGQPSLSRLLASAISDRDAFRESVSPVFDLKIDRIVVGHGDPIEGSEVVTTALEVIRGI